jgi:hypothetical protein
MKSIKRRPSKFYAKKIVKFERRSILIVYPNYLMEQNFVNRLRRVNNQFKKIQPILFYHEISKKTYSFLIVRKHGYTGTQRVQIME